MNAVIKPALAAAIAPRFPSLPIGGLAGTSLKHEHLAAIRAEGAQRGFFEVHAENYMGAGGLPHRALEAIRRDHPLSLHGVCMSIGGERLLDPAHLARFKHLVERYEPALVSEHLAWSTHENTYFNDLLPLPYTAATLARVCDHINHVQEAIGRSMLLENPSTYIAFRESTMSETDFIARSCGVPDAASCSTSTTSSSPPSIRASRPENISPTFRCRMSARSISPVMPSKSMTRGIRS
jgi:uncharacterized protein (UPF0276 family)